MKSPTTSMPHWCSWSPLSSYNRIPTASPHINPRFITTLTLTHTSNPMRKSQLLRTPKTHRLILMSIPLLTPTINLVTNPLFLPHKCQWDIRRCMAKMPQFSWASRLHQLTTKLPPHRPIL